MKSVYMNTKNGKSFVTPGGYGKFLPKGFFAVIKCEDKEQWVYAGRIGDKDRDNSHLLVSAFCPDHQKYELIWFKRFKRPLTLYAEFHRDAVKECGCIKFNEFNNEYLKYVYLTNENYHLMMSAFRGDEKAMEYVKGVIARKVAKKIQHP